MKNKGSDIFDPDVKVTVSQLHQSVVFWSRLLTCAPFFVPGKKKKKRKMKKVTFLNGDKVFRFKFY